jgi:ATP-dependent DNA helicase RecQ
VTTSTPEFILKNTFGYDSFLPMQREVIENVLTRKDTLAVMPTGGGKSLCYQVPALLLEGLTVVISPLIALMKDQVEQLQALGIPAVALNSTLSGQTYQNNLASVRRGEVRLLYVAPETLFTPRIFALLDAVKVDLITIDEAHCISEWGHDFRPEYRKLVDVRKRFPQAVCLALTATATQRVQEDIQTSLGFAQSNKFVSSFNRRNLFIEVQPKEDALRQTLAFLQKHEDEAGIIYCFSRKQVDNLTAQLVQAGFSALPYHAGLENDQRKANQEAFIRDDAQIIVATIAFGMGINKPNVRFILHHDLPKSIESYYQEIGRAGRDGLPAHCLLLFTYADAAKLRYFIRQKQGKERHVAQQHLEAIIEFAENCSRCRRVPLLAYFGESYGRNPGENNCGNCDYCGKSTTAMTDITLPAQKFLSCVKRTGETFAADHVVKVLRGSRSKMVQKLKHHHLSTYGIGKEWSKQQWLDFSRQLVHLGYLQEVGNNKVLRLTDNAVQALRQRTPIMGNWTPVEKPSRREISQPPDDKPDEALFKRLRQKRKEIADALDVPPYVIFSDRTLVAMATHYPQSPENLIRIHGVGKIKLSRYGDSFLETIRSYVSQTKKIPLRKDKTQTPDRSPDTAKSINLPTMAIGQAYHQGTSIEQLMGKYAVQAETILKLLERYVLNGNTLRCGDDLLALAPAMPEDQQAVFEAFDYQGCKHLSPIFEALNKKIGYDDLRVLRLIYLINKN